MTIFFTFLAGPVDLEAVCYEIFRAWALGLDLLTLPLTGKFNFLIYKIAIIMLPSHVKHLINGNYNGLVFIGQCENASHAHSLGSA